MGESIVLRVGARGRVTIPPWVLEAEKLKVGDKARITVEKEEEKD